MSAASVAARARARGKHVHDLLDGVAGYRVYAHGRLITRVKDPWNYATPDTVAHRVRWEYGEEATVDLVYRCGCVQRV